MDIKIKFDAEHNAQCPTFVLCTRNGTKIGAIPARDINYAAHMNSADELLFIVDKFDNNKQCDIWNSIQNFKLVYVNEWNKFFESTVEINESNQQMKTVTCVSLGDAEASNVKLYGLEVNTETDIAREDYVKTILYDPDHTSGSLLHRVMQKMPLYQFKHIDASIASIQRTFSFDDVYVYDALQEIAEEINCIFLLEVELDSDGNMVRSISAYDLESYCLDCGKRGDFLESCPECGSTNIQLGYGEDTSIFVSVENLADNITYTTDTGSVKNAFKLEAGDDLMTYTIAACNPNGSPYIWYVSDETRADMSEELQERLSSYDSEYVEYNDKYKTSFTNIDKISIQPVTSGASVPVSFLNNYNNLIDKYQSAASSIDVDLRKIDSTIIGYPKLMLIYYDTVDFNQFLTNIMMPSVSLLADTTAEQEAAKITSKALSSVSESNLSSSVNVATSTVLGMAKTLIDARYQVKAVNTEWDDVLQTDASGVKYYQWKGYFVITNYSDEEDTATSQEITVKVDGQYTAFVKQRLDKALNSASDTNYSTDIIGLFNLDVDENYEHTSGTFDGELSKYCLNSLNIFYSACQSCIDIMITQGISEDTTTELYQTLYYPFYVKLDHIAKEIELREQEIAVITGKYDSDGLLDTDGMQTIITSIRSYIQEILDFETYLGTELWKEFSAYRRDDTYKNENYISDGLNNTELFNNAFEFLETAKKEIFKSATQQHSISGTLKNLLVMKEFSPIVSNFKLGNWIRISVDENIYRLRLIGFDINFNDLSTLGVTFSDVMQSLEGWSDIKDILQQSASITKTYSTVSRQAGQGKKANTLLNNWVNNGLSLTTTKIVNSADNQNVTWDEHGLLCREQSPITDEYDDCQTKLINNGIYITDDGWKTSKAGVGKFIYYDPKTKQYVDAYGVIADTIVGNIVLSKEVGIYNEDGNITLNQNGFTLTTNDVDGADAKNVFTIQKEVKDSDGSTTTVPLLYVNDEGELMLNGSIQIVSSSGSNNTLDDVNHKVEDINDAIEQVEQSKNRVWYQTSAPSGTNHRVNDIWFDTDDNNLMHMWDGTSWVAQTFGSTAISNGSISSEKLYGDTAIMREIIAGSIQANSVAIGDFTNYCQLNESSASKWKFDVESDVGGSWFISNPMARDKQISEWYPAKSGDKFLVKYQIATSVKGNTTSGGTDSVYVASRIALFTRDGNHSNRTYNFATATKPSDDSLNVVDVSSIITLPTPSDRSVTEFAVYLQTESYGNFSGTLKVRNIQVLKMTTGELIVDGSVTANKIDVNDLFAQDITATGTISGLKLRGKDIDIISTSETGTDGDVDKWYQCEISTPEDPETQVRQILLRTRSRGGTASLRISSTIAELESDFDVTGLTTFYGSIPHYASSRGDAVYFIPPMQHILPDEANQQMWTYDKYADGRLRCTCNIFISTNISTKLGNMYRSASVYTVSNYAYPLTFTSQPVVQVNFMSSNNLGAMVWLADAGTTTIPPHCYLVRPTSSTGVEGYLSITVEGYWKDYSC